MDAIAATLKVDTPDEYINAAAGNFGIAAETIWDQKNECVLHGGVAWRTMLAGWRGPYNLDALGNHDRAVQEIRHWLKRQNTTPVTTGDPAIGPWDPNMHHARKEGMLHSNGDISNNHYDMNMVFIDMTAAAPDVDGRPGVCEGDLASTAAAPGVGAPIVPQDLQDARGQGTCRCMRRMRRSGRATICSTTAAERRTLRHITCLRFGPRRRLREALGEDGIGV